MNVFFACIKGAWTVAPLAKSPPSHADNAAVVLLLECPIPARPEATGDVSVPETNEVPFFLQIQSALAPFVFTSRYKVFVAANVVPDPELNEVAAPATKRSKSYPEAFPTNRYDVLVAPVAARHVGPDPVPTPSAAGFVRVTWLY